MIKTLNFAKYNLNFNNDSDILFNNISNLNSSYILNSQSLNENKYDIIENFVNQIYLFHHKRLNLDTNNNYYISFSIENDETFHLNYYKDDNSQERKYPLCSTLTYLNNSLNPVVITDIDFNDYKYKIFKHSTNLLFSFPYKLEHICFDGKYYYGKPNVFIDKDNNPLILKINIWDKKPPNINYYISDLNNTENSIYNNFDISFTESLFHRQLFLDNKLINKNFLEEMLYNKNNDLFIEFKNIFENIENYYSIEENIKINKNLKYRLPVEVNIFDCNNLIIIQTEKLPIIQNNTFYKLIDKYGNILYDLYSIYYKKELKNLNRFYNYKNINKYFTVDICKWLVNQINIYIRKAKIQKTSLIKIDNSKSIFDFCLIVIETLYDNISKLYELNDIKIDIKNISILYINNSCELIDTDNNESNLDSKNNINNSILEHIKNNNSFMTAIIQLNNNNIVIDENINLSIGDLLLVNTLRFNELNIFNNKDINYYLIYEIDFKYDL
jgi:hypothetical protein